jgi:hypothetical protein
MKKASNNCHPPFIRGTAQQVPYGDGHTRLVMNGPMIEVGVRKNQ